MTFDRHHYTAARQHVAMLVPACVDRYLVGRWARRVLADPHTVVIDTETTDLGGWVCEVAAVTPAGDVLVDSLVDPRAPITAEASAVHGIHAVDVRGAPTWPTIHTALTGRSASRWVAYNAPYDYGVIVRESARHGLPAGAMADEGRWECVMRRRAQAERAPWQRLDGGHRALDDVYATLDVLHELAAHRW